MKLLHRKPEGVSIVGAKHSLTYYVDQVDWLKRYFWEFKEDNPRVSIVCRLNLNIQGRIKFNELETKYAVFDITIEGKIYSLRRGVW